MIRKWAVLLMILAFLTIPFYSMGSYAVPIDTKEFSDINIFYTDGYLSHYYVELYNPSLTGEVYIYHPADSFDFTVQTTNIKRLIVDVQSLYDDEAGDVWVSLPEDFRAWVASHISYNISLSGDGYLSTIGITNSENLNPEVVMWNGIELSYSNPSEGSLLFDLPEHGTEDNEINVYYDIEFGSSPFYSGVYRFIFYGFLVLPVLVGSLLTFKKKVLGKFR